MNSDFVLRMEWLPPIDAKWHLPRDMRLYVIGIAHFKWAILVMQRLVVVDEKGPRRLMSHWCDGRCPRYEYCHGADCKSRPSGDILIGCCTCTKTKVWKECDACISVRADAGCVDLYHDTFILPGEKHLLEYYERVREALVPRPGAVQYLVRQWCDCGKREDHDAAHCERLDNYIN